MDAKGLRMSDFADLAPRDQAEFLTSFVFQLTISARDVFHMSGANMVEQLRAINELNHCVLAFVHTTLFGNGRETYPPDVIMDILRSSAEKEHLREAISSAWRGAQRAFSMRT